MRRGKSKISPKAVNLILLVASFLTAALACLGLLFNFITMKSRESLSGYSVKENWGLGEWFENINDMENFDKIGNWQFARVMLIVSLVLLAAMAVLLVLRFFIKHPAVKWSAIGVGMAVAACAVIFMATAIGGCSVLSERILTTSVKYIPNLGVFWFGICAIISAILTEVSVTRK
ncbi:MAG: hypothetical protein NC133_00440 [Prevotella sp.]|nr:hypothetical protein [Prevotella sp.]